MILILAKEYGQAPEDVEKWEEYWFNRAALSLEANSIKSQRDNQRHKKKRR